MKNKDGDENLKAGAIRIVNSGDIRPFIVKGLNMQEFSDNIFSTSIQEKEFMIDLLKAHLKLQKYSEKDSKLNGGIK